MKISELIERWEMDEFKSKFEQTQGASGDITASAAVGETSKEAKNAPDPAASEPPTPAQQQAEAGSGEIDVDLFNFDLQPIAERAIYRIGTEGALWISAKDCSTIELPNADVYRLYDFLMETIKVWHPASRRWSEK